MDGQDEMKEVQPGLIGKVLQLFLPMSCVSELVLALCKESVKFAANRRVQSVPLSR